MLHKKEPQNRLRFFLFCTV